MSCYVIWILTFIFHVKTKDFFEDIANDIEKWFDTSNFDPSL